MNKKKEQRDLKQEGSDDESEESWKNGLDDDRGTNQNQTQSSHIQQPKTSMAPHFNPIRNHEDTMSYFGGSRSTGSHMIHSFDCREGGSSVLRNGGRIERESVSVFDKIGQSISKGLNSFSFFSSSTRRKCRCTPQLPDDSATCANANRWILSYYKPKDLPNLKGDYEKLLREVDANISDKQSKQIEKDLNRTFGEAEFLDRKVLKRILSVWSIFDPTIGYVQGMNFIVGSLLYHAEEYIAFYLLEMLIGRFEMRDIYQDELPGISKHCKMITKLMQEFLPDLHSWFDEQGVITDLFCSAWIFSLFNTMIPLKFSSIFYDHLFKQNWIYFYKVILQILEGFEKSLLFKDMAEILEFFSSKNLKSFDQQEEAEQGVDWEELLNQAALIKIDKNQIEHILDKFDSESKDFNFETTHETLATSTIVSSFQG